MSEDSQTVATDSASINSDSHVAEEHVALDESKSEDVGGELEESHLKQKVADLEAQLRTTSSQVIVLQEALANVVSRLTAIEGGSPDVREQSKPHVITSPTTSSASRTKVPSPAAVKAKPTLTGTGRFDKKVISKPANLSLTAPHTNKSPTSTTTTSSQPASGSTTPTSSHKKLSTDAKKSVNSPSPPEKPASLDKAASTLEKPLEKPLDKPAGPPPVKSNYYVGKRNIFYHIPGKYTKDVKTNLTTTLAIDFAYGYNSRLKQNLYFNESGHLVYGLAGMGVVYDYATKEQKYFLGHNDDVSSVTMHPNRKYVCTGQVDPKGKQLPFLCIWDSKTMKEVGRIGEFHDRAICSVAFSPDGKYLISVGDDDSHTMGLWKWEEKAKENKPLLQTMVSKGDVYGNFFNIFRDPKVEDKDEAEEEKSAKEKPEGVFLLEICNVGVKQVKFMSIFYNEKDPQHPYTCVSKSPSYVKEAKGLQKAFTCATWVDRAHCVVGTESGQIFVFKRQVFKQLLKGHDSQVGGITLIPDGFATVGYDGKLRLFTTAEFKEKAVIDLGPTPGLQFVSVAAFTSADTKVTKIAAGTSAGSIVEISLDTNKQDVIMMGHRGEIWALGTHPTKPWVITGAADRIIRFWDYTKKTPVKELSGAMIKATIRSAAFHPTGNTFAVGLSDGSVHIYETETLKKLFGKKIHSELIDCLAFSPDGKSLAVASWDQTLDIMDVEKLQIVHTMKGHSSSVQHLTWTADSKYLISNSKDYEILYWKAATGKVAKETDVLDSDFYNWVNILGWPVVGVFQEGGDGSDINTLHISGDSKSDYRVIATGDDGQMVRLYRFPATQSKNVPVKSFTGHSSHVTRVRFSPDSNYLFSTGGDETLVQWKHIPYVEPPKFQDT